MLAALGDEQLARLDGAGDGGRELLLARGLVGRHLEVQVGSGGNGIPVDRLAVLVDQFVLEFAGQLGGGLVGLEADRPDLALGLGVVEGEGKVATLDPDGGVGGLLQSTVLLAEQVVVQLPGAVLRGLVAFRQVQRRGFVGVGEVPDGRLGGGDGFLLGQAGDASGLGDLGQVGLGVAVLGDPGDLGLDIRVVLELVRAREVLPAADAQAGAVDDVDLDLDAVGLDDPLLGVHGEQVRRDMVGLWFAVLNLLDVQTVAGHALAARPDLRVAAVWGVVGVCRRHTEGQGCREGRGD